MTIQCTKTRPLPAKCFCNGAVPVKFKFYLRSTFLCRGQDSASKTHHCRNTNVVRHAVTTL